jgi:hypothetical protein
LEHLQHYLESDGWLDPAILNKFSTLSEVNSAKIRACFTELGLDTLSPVYKALQEEFSYADLKLVRLCMLAELAETNHRKNAELGSDLPHT